MFDCVLNIPPVSMNAYGYCLLVTVWYCGDYRYCTTSFNQTNQSSQLTSQVNQPCQSRLGPNPTHGVIEFSCWESFLD